MLPGVTWLFNATLPHASPSCMFVAALIGPASKRPSPVEPPLPPWPPALVPVDMVDMPEPELPEPHAATDTPAEMTTENPMKRGKARMKDLQPRRLEDLAAG